MHITCVICSDLITASDDTYSVNCGHLFHYNCVIQWLEQSKTCPQCRARASEKNIHRVYFNVANIDGSDDPSSLQNKIDTLKFKLKTKDVAVKAANEEKADMENKNKALRMELKKTEEKVESLNGALLCIKERMNHLKHENKKMNELQESNKMLQSRVDTLCSLETIRMGSAAEVDDLLNSIAGKSTECRSLATYCSVLKRELLEMERKRKMTQSKMAEYNQNLSKAYAERDSLKEALKASDKDKYNLTEELVNVKEVLSRSENKVQQQKGIIRNMGQIDSSSSAVSILERLKSGSPSKENVASEMLRLLAESPAPEELLSMLKRVAKSPNSLHPPTKRETLKRSRAVESECLTPEIFVHSKNNAPSLGVPKLSDPTEENSGLVFKPSSSGFQPKVDPKPMSALHLKQGYSIFQKPRLSQRPEELLHKNKEEVYYDGMGGQRKHEIFPNPKRGMTALGAKPKLRKPVSTTNSGLSRLDSFLNNPH